MRYLPLLIIACLFNTSSFGDSSPENTLEKYLNVLKGKDLTGIAELMDPNSMAALKSTMIEAIKHQDDKGEYGLVSRVFGERVAMKQVEETTAAFYLNALATEILTAAQSQHLNVDEFEMLGSVPEGEQIVHIVVRLRMSQNQKHADDVQVYSLVKHGDEWKLKFPSTIRQLLAIIESGVRRQP